MKTYKEFLKKSKMKYHVAFAGFPPHRDIISESNSESNNDDFYASHNKLMQHYPVIENYKENHPIFDYVTKSYNMNSFLYHGYKKHGRDHFKNIENETRQDIRDDYHDEKENEAYMNGDEPEEYYHMDKQLEDNEWNKSRVNKFINSAYALDNELKKHESPDDFHVYTGVKWNPENLKDKDTGNIHVHLPSFTSTTILKSRGEHYAALHDANETKHMLKIHIPKGSAGYYVPASERRNTRTGEHEFLLPRHTRIHIDPNPTINSKNNIHTWHAKLVHDGFKPTRFMDEE